MSGADESDAARRTEGSYTKGSRKMRIAALTTFATALLLASSAGAQRSSATLTIEPNAAPAWGWAHGSGCGYAVGSEAYIDIHKPEALAFQSAMPDASGCVSFAFTTDGPGTYLVEARQRSHNTWRVLATYQLPVQ
jgi:hypothetical protein